MIENQSVLILKEDLAISKENNMNDVFDILQKNKIELVLINIENDGYYDPALNIIFINQLLNEEKQKEVILHELGHVINHKELASLYNNPSYRTKMEYEATKYMITYLINESDGQFNYSDVLQNYNLGLGWECKFK